VQEFIISKGGSKEAAFSFQIQQHYVKLRLDADISLSTTPLSTLSPLGHCKELDQKKRGLEQNVLQFVQNKLEIPFYVKDFIIPLHNANHWSMIIMNEDQFLHYDLLKIENIFPFALVHKFFSKLWASRQGPMSQNVAWKQATINNFWVWLGGPQQKFN
jgi:hypothetical protein